LIPKIIHYCWFGKNKKSDIFYKCLDSWKKFCPDYKIIEWNETNSNQFVNTFYKNALRKKKYAFAADYIRVKVLHEYGGIYLDTDMLLVKNIDNLLKYNFFAGYEAVARVNYALFGGIQTNHFLKQMISYYNENNFDEFNPPIITHTFKELVKKDNLKDNEILFDPEYFYPLTFKNRENDYRPFITKNTFAVHLWNHSWNINKEQTIFSILKDIKSVCINFLFYKYNKAYFFKYLSLFCKKIYNLIRNKFKRP
jgi:mannosyltransferase OCH1-like enzyme